MNSHLFEIFLFLSFLIFGVLDLGLNYFNFSLNWLKILAQHVKSNFLLCLSNIFISFDKSIK